MAAPIAPITGMLRKKFIFDLTGALGFGTAAAMYFWYKIKVPAEEDRIAKLKVIRASQGLPVSDRHCRCSLVLTRRRSASTSFTATRSDSSSSSLSICSLSFPVACRGRRQLGTAPALYSNLKLFRYGDRLAQLQPDAVARNLTHALVDDIAAELTPEPMSGMAWFAQAQGNAARTLLTGCAGLDAFLGGGGWRAGEVYELVGVPGSGKTELLYATCAAMLAARGGVGVEDQQQRPCGSAVWLDATAGFSAMRVQRHLVARLGPGSPDANVLLDHVRRVQCVLPEECVKALALIEDQLETASHDPFWSSLRLIVLDSVHALFAALVGDAREPWEYMANQVMGTLKRIATDHGIVVVVINHATRWKRQVKPALGHSWEFLVDERITIDFVLSNTGATDAAGMDDEDGEDGVENAGPSRRTQLANLARRVVARAKTTVGASGASLGGPKSATVMLDWLVE
ncbi:DNA repair protein rad51d [Allomyces javanicus]|nr:DNA repair protein rad51d [Allomyces javanicus]